MTATASWSQRRVPTRRPDQGRWRRHAWGTVKQVVGWALVAAVAWLLLPLQYGGSLGTTVVSGHSMEPTYWTGDLVVTWRTGDYEVGDAVVYQVPEGEPGEGLHVVHRVVEETDQGFVMLGDNNDEPDLWTPTSADVLGEVVVHVPEGGRWMRLLLSPLALALLCGVLVTLAVVSSGKDETGDRGDDEPGGPDDPPGPPAPDQVRPQVRRRLQPLPHPRRTPRDPDRAHPALLRSPWARTTLVALAAAGVVLPVVGTAGQGASASTLGGLRSADLTALRVDQAPEVGPAELTDVASSFEITSESPTGYCATVTVSTSSPTWVRWRSTLHPFVPGYGRIHWLESQPDDVWGASSITFVRWARSWVVQGADGNELVRAGHPQTWGYCAPWSASIPLTTASVEATITSESGNGSKAPYCARVTVSTTSSQWIRWRATVSHETPGLGGTRYRLNEEPEEPTNAATIEFDGGNRWEWTVQGVDTPYIKAGSPTSFTYCKDE